MNRTFCIGEATVCRTFVCWINIPPFKGATPLQLSDVQKTQTIARVRIYVERVIGQVKRRFSKVLYHLQLLDPSGLVSLLYVN